MRRLLTLPLLVLALVAAGCAASRPADTYTVSMKEMRPQGLHDGANGRIYLHPRITEEHALTCKVCAHELGHALRVPHQPVPGRIMSPSHGPGQPPIPTLTPAEIRAARPPAKPIKVLPGTSMTPPAYEGLKQGADLWNRTLQRPVFEVGPPGSGGDCSTKPGGT